MRLPRRRKPDPDDIIVAKSMELFEAIEEAVKVARELDWDRGDAQESLIGPDSQALLAMLWPE